MGWAAGTRLVAEWCGLFRRVEFVEVLRLRSRCDPRSG
jgi:hypothetical protein